MDSESARMSSAAEARFRIDYPNSNPRVVKVVALDAASERVVKRVAQQGWQRATFFTSIKFEGAARSGEIAEPSLHRPALAAARCPLELDGGEERRALASLLRHAFDHALARRIERDDLDHARLGIGIIDPEPRFGGRAHACAFAVHDRILFPHATFGPRRLALPLGL